MKFVWSTIVWESSEARSILSPAVLRPEGACCAVPRLAVATAAAGAEILAHRVSHSLDLEVAHAMKLEESLARTLPAAKQLAATRKKESTPRTLSLLIGKSFGLRARMNGNEADLENMRSRMRREIEERTFFLHS